MANKWSQLCCVDMLMISHLHSFVNLSMLKLNKSCRYGSNVALLVWKSNPSSALQLSSLLSLSYNHHHHGSNVALLVWESNSSSALSVIIIIITNSKLMTNQMTGIIGWWPLDISAQGQYQCLHSKLPRTVGPWSSPAQQPVINRRIENNNKVTD